MNDQETIDHFNDRVQKLDPGVARNVTVSKAPATPLVQRLEVALQRLGKSF
jgi:hypothetical protein